MSMAEESRKYGQPPFDIFVGPIPMNQGSQGESMTKIVNPRSGVVGWPAQTSLTGEVVKGSVHCRYLQAAAIIVDEKAKR